MLDAARRKARLQVAQRVQALSAPSSSTVVGVLRQVEQPPEFPETRVQVDVGGGAVWTPADPGAYVVGGGVYVEVDSLRRPRRVTGPTGVQVPDSPVPTTVEGGALPVVIQPAAMLDQESRDRANEAVRQLSELFTPSDREPTPADGEGKPEGAYWILVGDDGGDAARWRWVEGAWVPAPLGPELILSQAVIASLLTNEVFTKNLTLADELDGYLVRVTARGIEIFGPDGFPLSRYGAFAENALNFYRAGEPVASISDAGVVSALEGAFGSLSVDGTNLMEILARMPRGLVYNRNFPVSRDVTERGGHSYIVFDCEPFRSYRVTCRVVARNRDGAGMQARFYGEIVNAGDTAAVPTLASPLAAEGRTFTFPDAYQGGSFVDQVFDFMYSPTGTVPKTASLLLAVNPIGTTGEGRLEIAGAWWTVEDLGVNDSSVQKGGSYSTVGGGSSGGGSTPAPETPKQTRTRTYNSTGWRTFQNVTGNDTGTHTTSVSSPTQGYTPYYPSAGQYGSHWYFDSAQIQADLAGATVLSARVKLKCTHSHANSGGTARLHIHGYSTAGNWAAPDPIPGGDVHFSKGQSRWLGVTYQGWRTGAVRGVAVYSRGSSSTEFYMRFATQAVLEITYEK